MPDLRRDPVTGRWVIISTERAKRPQEFIREPVRFKSAHCPFCPGHEASTPPEILAYRTDAGQIVEGVPDAVVHASAPETVAALLQWAQRERVPVTCRGGGSPASFLSSGRHACPGSAREIGGFN